MGGGKGLVAETDVLVVQPNQHGKYLRLCNLSILRTTYLLCLLDMSLFFLPLL